MVQFLRYIPLLSDDTIKLGILTKGNFYEPWVEVAAEVPSFKWLIMGQYGSHLDDIIIEGWNSIPTDYTHKIEFMDLANIYPVIKPDVWHISNEKPIKTAQPSSPVSISGLEYPPSAGDQFYVLKDEKTAKNLSEERATKEREKRLSS